MFDFEVIYVPGAENILRDALSRIYSHDAPGTVRAASEYTEYNDTAVSMQVACNSVDMVPIFVGLEACAAMVTNFVARRSKRIQEYAGAETRRVEASDEFAARMKTKIKVLPPVAPASKLIKNRAAVEHPDQGPNDPEGEEEAPRPAFDLQLGGIDLCATI